MNLGNYWKRYGTLTVLGIILIGLSIGKPQYFLTFDNFRQIGIQSSVYIMLAFAEFFPLLLAGVDLSVGSVAGLVGMIIAKLMVSSVPVWLAIIIGLVFAIVFGMINGWLINKLGLHPFIVTLGTSSIFSGITLVISNGQPVFGLPKIFSKISSFVYGVPVPFIIIFLVFLLLHFLTTKTVLGRNLFAIGGNAESAWFSGINVNLHRLIGYGLSGLLAGIAGIIMTSRIGAAEAMAGNGYETFAIAACIIGGTSFFGGEGKIGNVIIGGLIIGAINNGLNIMNVQSFWQQIVMGTLIIGSVALDKYIGIKSE